jgi:8-amino-3,8-dideoxy-alpha-D-manno-octulosonate transaminase
MEYTMEERNSPGALALNGGVPAVHDGLPPMFPGGMWLDGEEEAAVLEVLRNKRLFRFYGAYEGPSKVAELEKNFAAFTGTPYAQAVTSGTAALICALRGMGIGPGDEVIVPAYTWIASASAVLAVGAVPVMAEVDESLTLDPRDIESRISPYTKAIIPVHMRGAPCAMDEIMGVAERKGLWVLEDAAQANGASFHGKRVGSIGDAGAFSLQFNKVITAGEGGMMITHDEPVFHRAVMYHDVVGGQRYDLPEESILPGINFRMPELLGAVALVQLGKLERLLAAMREKKQTIKNNIAGLAANKGIEFRKLNDPEGEAGLALVFLMPDDTTAHYAEKALSAEGLPARTLYKPDLVDYHVFVHWSPIMNQRAWHPEASPWKHHLRVVEYKAEDCPRSLDLLGRAVHMDVSPDLSSSQIEEILEALHKVFGSL